MKHYGIYKHKETREIAVFCYHGYDDELKGWDIRDWLSLEHETWDSNEVNPEEWEYTGLKAEPAQEYGFFLALAEAEEDREWLWEGVVSLGNSTPLRELIEEYDASGFVLADAGNGSAGPSWIEWDEEASQKYGDIELFDAADRDAITAKRTVLEIEPKETMSSEWVIDNPLENNPYRYRVIF